MKIVTPLRTIMLALAGFNSSALAVDLAPDSFGPPLFLQYNDSPLLVRGADLDGDGKLDIIAANSSSITIFKNHSSSVLDAASFPDALSIPIGTSVFSVAAGDLNNDGKADLVISRAGGVTILQNKSTIGTLGSDSFSAPIELPLPSSSPVRDAVLADLDGDGKRDLIFLDSDGGSVVVFKNDFSGADLTAGSFINRLNLPAVIGPNNLVSEDLDGDGKLDLVVIGDGGLAVFQNTSSGGGISFSDVPMFASGVGPLGLSVSDLDGDGKPEIILPNYFNFSFTILKNSSSSGTIHFLNQLEFGAGDFPRSVAVADLNRDGRNDLLVGNEFGGTVSMLQNHHVSGSLAFTSFPSVVDLFPGGEPFHLTTGDFNQDGKLDIAVALFQAGGIALFQNNLDLPVLPPLQPPPVITNPPPNQAPVARAGSDVVLESLGNLTEVTLDGTLSTDPDNDSLLYQWSLNGNPVGSSATLSLSVPVGVHQVILRVTDPSGAHSEDTVQVSIIQANRAPVANAGPDAVVECTGKLTAVRLDGRLSHDPDNDPLQYQWLLNGRPIGTNATFSLLLTMGVHQLTLRVTDPSGATSEDTLQASIVDTTAPVIDAISANPNRLFSPNHKMRPVQIRVRAHDNCDTAPQSKIVSVRSNESSDGRGDGHTSVDWVITGNLTLKLRAEHSGRGLGRIYTITVETRDDSGNSSRAEVLVRVPKPGKK